MAVSIFSLVYLLGFLIPLQARSWLTLGVIFVACCVLVFGAFSWAATGGGLIVLAFSLPIMLFAFGALAGHATKAVLLSLRWPNMSRKAIAPLLVGFAVLPLGNAVMKHVQTTTIPSDLCRSSYLSIAPEHPRMRCFS